VIGLSETQGARNSIGEVLPVRWVGKRKRIRMAHTGAPKQVVECRSRTAAVGVPPRIIGKASRL
jgi:hypothetical protein